MLVNSSLQFEMDFKNELGFAAQMFYYVVDEWVTTSEDFRTCVFFVMIFSHVTSSTVLIFLGKELHVTVMFSSIILKIRFYKMRLFLIFCA